MSRIRVMATSGDLHNSHDKLPIIRVRAKGAHRDVKPGSVIKLELTSADRAHLDSIRHRLGVGTLAEAALLYMRTAWCEKAWKRFKKALGVAPRRRVRRRR